MTSLLNFHTFFRNKQNKTITVTSLVRYQIKFSFLSIAFTYSLRAFLGVGGFFPFLGVVGLPRFFFVAGLSSLALAVVDAFRVRYLLTCFTGSLVASPVRFS